MPARRTFLAGLVALVALTGCATGQQANAPAPAPAAARSVAGSGAAGLDVARLDVGGIPREYVQVQGQVRSYLLDVGTPSATPRPLLLLFHGVDESSADFLSDTSITAAAERAGVIVAAPDSPDNSWNDGRFEPGGRDDDGFSMAVIADLVAGGLVDPTRVTVAGFSNGAGMAMELAARHPESIAAMVSVSGELVAGPGQVLPVGRVPSYFIHGTGDLVQPLVGRAAGMLLPAQISEQQTIQTFRTANGVGLVSPSVSVLPKGPRSSAGPVTIYHWAKAGAVPVSYALIKGLGHKWPALACGASRRAGTASFLRARLPFSGAAGCATQGNQNVRLVDISANALVLGVAASARLGVATV